MFVCLFVHIPLEPTGLKELALTLGLDTRFYPGSNIVKVTLPFAIRAFLSSGIWVKWDTKNLLWLRSAKRMWCSKCYASVLPDGAKRLRMWVWKVKPKEGKKLRNTNGTSKETRGSKVTKNVRAKPDGAKRPSSLEGLAWSSIKRHVRPNSLNFTYSLF